LGRCVSLIRSKPEEANSLGIIPRQSTQTQSIEKSEFNLRRSGALVGG
jgi:hypothetical protein